MGRDDNNDIYKDLEFAEVLFGKYHECDLSHKLIEEGEQFSEAQIEDDFDDKIFWMN